MIQSGNIYTVDWYIPKRVLLIQYLGGVITKEDLEELAGHLERFYQEGEAPIHMISDNTHQGDLKVGLPELRQVFAVMNQPNWGWIMFVNIEQMVGFFATLVSHAFKLKIRNVETIEKAITTLQRLDSTLE